jgi:hypothetical protein
MATSKSSNAKKRIHVPAVESSRRVAPVGKPVKVLKTGTPWVCHCGASIFSGMIFEHANALHCSRACAASAG